MCIISLVLCLELTIPELDFLMHKIFMAKWKLESRGLKV